MGKNYRPGGNPAQTKCLSCPHHTPLCDDIHKEQVRKGNPQGRFETHSVCWCCANGDSGLKCEYINSGKPIEGWIAKSRIIEGEKAYNVRFCPNFKRTEDDTNEYTY